jgi:type I restriction-modification system DNA methylase subunit
LSDGVFSYDATNDEIAKINYTLNISRYAHQSIISTDECGSLDDAVARWSDTDAQVVSALDEILNVVR